MVSFECRPDSSSVTWFAFESRQCILQKDFQKRKLWFVSWCEKVTLRGERGGRAQSAHWNEGRVTVRGETCGVPERSLYFHGEMQRLWIYIAVNSNFQCCSMCQRDLWGKGTFWAGAFGALNPLDQTFFLLPTQKSIKCLQSAKLTLITG